MNRPDFNAIFAYLLQLCHGDEDSAILLAYFIAATESLRTGQRVERVPFEGTPRFKAAHSKLKEFGISKFNPKTGQHEVRVGEILFDFCDWYDASSGQTVN